MLRFLVQAVLAGVPIAGGPNAYAIWTTCAFLIGTLALVAWGMAPIAIWIAWGMNWNLLWLLPSAAWIFMMRPDAGGGGG